MEMGGMNKFILTSVLTLLSLNANAKFKCLSNNGYSDHQPLFSVELEHSKYAPVTGEVKLKKSFSGFDAVFDSEDDDDGDGLTDLLANPVFVSYHLKGVQPDESGEYHEPEVSIKRPSDWYKSPEFDFLWNNRPEVSVKRIDNSYDGIGAVWNRGHWAMSDHVQRISPEAACNTHNFWNASPQAKDLNQGPWRHLENYSAAASNKFGEVWIITGPIFDKNKTIYYIGGEKEIPVAVPHALFKVLIREAGDSVDVLPFIYEQENELALTGKYKGKPIPSAAWVNCNKAGKDGHQYRHSQNLVSLAEIEMRTGLTFFSSIEENKRKALVESKPVKLWVIES